MKPYVEVVSSTVAHWLTNVMSAAGVDTTIFKPHSARSAKVFLLKIFWIVQIGLEQQHLGNSIRNQLLLFIKILSVLCSLCEGVACFLLYNFEHTLLYLLEILRNEIRFHE